MGQDHAWTEDTFLGSHTAQTDLQNMENNSLALKTNFKGDDATLPTDAEEGQFFTSGEVIHVLDSGTAKKAIFDYGNNRIAADAVKEASILNSAITTNKINNLAVTTGKINNLAVTKAKIDNTAGVCLIKTGTYTGDGSTSQGITGIGFRPKYIKIWKRPTVDGSNKRHGERVDGFTGGFAFLHIDAGGHEENEHLIISLDADGFTVDDNNGDQFPNKNGETYEYLALGAIV